MDFKEYVNSNGFKRMGKSNEYRKNIATIFRCSVYDNNKHYSLQIKNEVTCFPFVKYERKRIKTVEELSIAVNKAIYNLPQY